MLRGNGTVTVTAGAAEGERLWPSAKHVGVRAPAVRGSVFTQRARCAWTAAMSDRLGVDALTPLTVLMGCGSGASPAARSSGATSVFPVGIGGNNVGAIAACC